MAAKVTREAIEFVGVLPRWPDDDADFICHLLQTSYGRRLVTVAEVVRDLGFSDRAGSQPGDPPTDEYRRILRAFHAARVKGLVRRSGRKRWGLT